jgi:ABC-2 type transport system ATP-binding protein
MLKIKGLAKSFGAKAVLNGSYIEFESGRVYALLGPNGSGKSTFLRMLWGELTPSAGSLWHGDEAVDTESPRWKRIVGAVPDDDALIEGLSVRGHLRLCAALMGLNAAEARAREERLIELFGLGEAAEAAAAEDASRGNRKRLAIALALLGNPSILLMDEPYSGLDAERAEDLCAIFKALASRGLTIIFSCHGVELARKSASHAAIIENGFVRCVPLESLSPHAPSGLTVEDLLPWIG